MKRRQFIKTGSISVLASSLPLFAASAQISGRDYVKEEEKQVLVKGSYDVIVAGGGPAGVSAAIASGRAGAKTLLLETNGCLGGVWTSGLLTWILDHANKKGFMEELRTKLLERGASVQEHVDNHHVSFNPEAMKLLLEELCLEANVDFIFHTRVVSSVKNGGNRLTHVITESKSGREAWKGKLFIDATGDGDLAARSGCGFDFGDPIKGSFQPFSLLGLITGVNLDEIGSRSLMDPLKRAGYTPSYLKAGLFPIRNNLFKLMADQKYGYSPMDAVQVTKATSHARKEISEIVEALRSLGGPWKGIMLVATGEQIGTREGRRIHGLYTLTQDDLVNGARFDDAVCSTKYGVNVHNVSEEDHRKNAFSTGMGITIKEYDIPLRSLVSKDIENLMMAGRCISGDFIAHSSYRVTGNSVTMGEAVGKVAAYAALNDQLPQNTPKNKY